MTAPSSERLKTIDEWFAQAEHYCRTSARLLKQACAMTTALLASSGPTP